MKHIIIKGTIFIIIGIVAYDKKCRKVLSSVYFVNDATRVL